MSNIHFHIILNVKITYTNKRCFSMSSSNIVKVNSIIGGVSFSCFWTIGITLDSKGLNLCSIDVVIILALSLASSWFSCTLMAITFFIVVEFKLFGSTSAISWNIAPNILVENFITIQTMCKCVCTKSNLTWFQSQIMWKFWKKTY